MVLIRLRSSNLHPNDDITEEVNSDIPPNALADLAKEKFESFDQRPVKIYLDTGMEYTTGKNKLEEGQILYATQQNTQSLPDEGVTRLCILGPGAVGKSALTMRFTDDHFEEDYDPTIEESYRISANVDGRIAKLDILDTAGQEDFAALRPVWYRKKDGFLLVYAVNDPNSLEQLKMFYNDINQYYENDVVPPMLLIGNKVDLEETMTSKSLLENAENIAKNWNALEHMKTSAKTSYNVKAAFANIVRATRVKDEEARPVYCCSVL